MNNVSDETIYMEIVKSKIATNCYSAFMYYCERVIPFCPTRPGIARSLLRIAIRPLFYLGYFETQTIIEIFKSREVAELVGIKNMKDDYAKFMVWLNENRELVDISIKELEVCCIFYDLAYDAAKNNVILNHAVEKEMEEVFVSVSDREIEFHTFNEFRCFFGSMLRENNAVLSDSEIDRIILEEGIKERYFDCINAG